MSTSTLSLEIRRLREQSGLSLRGLGALVGVSASHLSDIEHDRRRPSEKLLRALARELRASGATFDGLEEHLTGIDAKTLAWAAITPGVRMLFRTARESGLRPLVLLSALRKAIGRLRGRAGKPGGGQ
ncbi:MAG: helix-turn-helix domain-containing protein [Candidatus Krumholzibacteriia bacterium]